MMVALREENKLALDSHPRELMNLRGLNKSKYGGGYLIKRNRREAGWKIMIDGRAKLNY